ncbi:MAG TPA: SPFH domain-containing protein [Bacillota bacterium]|nr:SPFH domain-containing protein [Bacillota bacterium]
MGLMNFVKSQFIEVIEWTDATSDTIAYRFPVQGNEIKMGAQLIVRESQSAIFVKDGQIADVFNPGKYTLSTENLPVLTKILSWKYGFNSPFKAEVYFVNTKQFANQKWGTSNPIMMRDADFGMVRLAGFGTYAFRVEDPAKLLKELFGTNASFETEDITDQLRSILISGISDAVAELKIPALDLATKYNELGVGAVEQLQPKFDAFGLQLSSVNVENLSLPEEVEKAMDQRASMGAIGNMQQFTQYQTAQAIRDAAKNPNNIGNSFAGFGMGAAIAQNVMQTLNNPAGGANIPTNPSVQAPQTQLCPKCQTPLPTGAKFCSGCGGTVQPANSTCPNCQAVVANGAKFCMNCGKPIA